MLDTRRVAGLIFGGDQMSDWTVMGRGHRYTFDNPQPALYDRIAAVKAIVGDVPVEGRLLFSNVGKFTKGIPKWVVMLDGIEVEFPVVDRGVHAVSRRSVLGGLEPAGGAAETQPALVHESVESEQLFGIARGGRGHALQRSRRASLRPPPRCAEGSRFVAPRLSACGFRSRGSRYGASVSISSLSAGMPRYRIPKFTTAALIACPAGDPDVQAQLQVFVQFGFCRR